MISLALVAAAACSPPGPPETGSASSPIVNGQIETGWPAVGALVMGWGGWGGGSFCSGTLIAPRWVLTAAHCVTSQPEMPLIPAFVQFFVGSDAHGIYKPGQKKGVLYDAKEFYPHPGYSADNLLGGNDIGLVELATDVVDVEPIPINTAALRGDLLGTPILFVGFGASNGVTNAGSGTKRSTHMPLVWIEDDIYNAEPQGSGTCFGDSGGPGLLGEGTGKDKVIGVVSAGAEELGQGDPCLSGYGVYTRVDAYASWIAQVTGIVLPSCEGPDTCFCAGACQPDGACDNAKCEVFDCPGSYLCSAGCPDDGGACALDCHLATTQKAKADVVKMTYCISKYCPPTVPEHEACIAGKCSKHIDSCLAAATPVMDCRAYAECRQSCPEGGALCVKICDSRATEQARAGWDAVSACLEAKCGVKNDAVGLATPCAAGQCAAQIGECFPPPCDLAGGSCPDGKACSQGLDGGPAKCVPSGDLSVGTVCTPGSPPPCDDGLACLGAQGEERCVQLCHAGKQCGDGEICGNAPEGAPKGIDACIPAPAKPDQASQPDASPDAIAADQASVENAPSRGSPGSGCGTGPAGAMPLLLALFLLSAIPLATRRS